MSPDNTEGPRRWKVKRRDGSRLEPASLEVLRHWVMSGQIEEDDFVINEELADWILASEAVELDDVFQKQRQEPEPAQVAAEEAVPEPSEAEQEVRVPDCAFHPGRPASEICVGCGKFICEECRQRVERKVYCRRCMAEKQAGVEPGAPVGPGASAGAVSGAGQAVETSRLAIASVVFLTGAVLVSVLIVVPRPNILAAPVAGFVAFMAALLGGLALSRIRQSGDSLRGKGLAFSGLIAGSVILAGTLAIAFVFVTRGGAGAGLRPSDAPIPEISLRRSGGAMQQGRRRRSSGAQREREAGAKRLLDQAGDLLGQGRLEEAIDKCEEILRLYPDTPTAKLVEDRLPVLLGELERQQAEAEALKHQNEGIAQERYEHAVKMYSDGDEATALELLRSIVENYPETDAAKEAAARIAVEEDRIAAENMERRDSEARELVARAERLIEAEQYTEALRLYRMVVDEYSETPTSAAAKPGLDRAEKLATDPSEREFRRIQRGLETKTYEESVAMLRRFLGKYPTSGRSEEARRLLDENAKQKRTADNLYNFGRAYFEDGKYEIALGRYGKLVRDYPRSRWVPLARQEYEETLRNIKE